MADHVVSLLEDFSKMLHHYGEGKAEPFQQAIVSCKAYLEKCPPICSQTVNDLINQIGNLTVEAIYTLRNPHRSQMNKSESCDEFRRLYLRLERVMEETESAVKEVQQEGNVRHEQRLLTLASSPRQLVSDLNTITLNPRKEFAIGPRYLEEIVEDFKSIEKKVKKAVSHQDGNGLDDQRTSPFASSSRQQALGGNNMNMVALDNDLEMTLMEQLVGGRSQIHVIPIVGMGGIGKTTLARILFDSQLIKESFDIRGWCTISQTYDAQEIVPRILKDIGVPLLGEKDGDQLLYQSLCGKKYLIVLDDVWNKQAWDDIKRLFPDNNNGSRFLLTTRHSEVATYANSFGLYHKMKLLDEDSSWGLLCREIFLQNNCPPDLVEIGKGIARKCQGLPLVISAIGGHLKKEMQTEEYWKHVFDNVSSVLTTTDQPSLEILTLSYNYLPHHLKAFFLYFGSFQEDDGMDVSEITHFWVAEGFVNHPGRSNNLEMVAEEYLRDIIERNLILVYKYDSFGKPKRCGIHDLFRDICRREAKREKFYSSRNGNKIDILETNNRQRRLTLSPNVTEDHKPSSSGVVSRNDSCSTTRFLICKGYLPSSIVILKLLGNRMSPIVFPTDILQLVNLKYLQLGHIREIPSSISRLRMLQTFIVSSLFAKSMPSEIWEMTQLRHILIPGFCLPDIPRRENESANQIQTLSEIIDFRCTPEVQKIMPYVKRLKILYRRPFYSLNDIACLSQLESLRWDFQIWVNDDIFLNLKFPVSLKKLVLIGCQIPWERMTIIGILPRLEVLKLKVGAMKGKVWETNDGEFKELRFLLIRYSNLEEWKTEKEHFPKLRHLVLQLCSDLQAIPDEIGYIPTLETIEVYKCSEALVTSAQEMIDEDCHISLTVSN